MVASLSRPGGNVTGFPAFVDVIATKWLELLREVAPSVDRVGFIFHPDAVPHVGVLRAAQSAAPSLNFKLIPLPIHNANEIVAAIKEFTSEVGGGLIVPTHAVTYSNRDLLIGLATSNRLPTVFAESIFAESGGLLAYGSDIADMFRGAASYVDLILKGATGRAPSSTTNQIQFDHQSQDRQGSRPHYRAHTA